MDAPYLVQRSAQSLRNSNMPQPFRKADKYQFALADDWIVTKSAAYEANLFIANGY